jgi:hypothetical protein
MYCWVNSLFATDSKQCLPALQQHIRGRRQPPTPCPAKLEVSEQLPAKDATNKKSLKEVFTNILH